jgi:hypothetical protein
MALRDTHTRTGAHQRLCGMAPQETAATDQGNKLAVKAGGSRSSHGTINFRLGSNATRICVSARAKQGEKPADRALYKLWPGKADQRC